MRWILRRDPGKNLDIEDEDAMSFFPRLQFSCRLYRARHVRNMPHFSDKFLVQAGFTDVVSGGENVVPSKRGTLVCGKQGWRKLKTKIPRLTQNDKRA
jgi:hypothetical protein